MATNDRLSAIGQFLTDNGLELDADPDDATRVMLVLASGGIDIAGLTEWLRPLVKAEA